jgi:putative FmdB family regulatory protein
MPLYEFRCATCGSTFELRRPAAQSQAPALCPDGHIARRVLSVFATAGHGPSEAGGEVMGCGPDCACAAGH